jgi:hypothetical protein
MKLIVKKGRTSFLCKVFIQDSTKGDGSGLTGLVFNSSGLVCYRARDDDGNAGATAITLATMTRGTWATGGFVEKDATNMPGVYEFGIPDAALATGSETAVIMLKGATNMAPVVIEIQLVAYDPQDSTALGISRIDAAISSRQATTTFPTNFSSLSIDGSGRVDVGKVTGTAQTARDLGANLDATISGIPAAVLAATVEGTYTVVQYLRGFASALLSKCSGLDTTSPVFRDTQDTKNRISATVDSNGNRSAVSLTLT